MLRQALIVLATVIIGISNLGAVTIFDTFGPGDSYDIGSGATLLGADVGIENEAGFEFTPGVSFNLGQVEFAAAHVIGANELELWLMTDAAGKPGSIIESFTFTDAMGPFGSNNPLLTAVSVLQPLLLGGTPYWLIANVPDASTYAVFNHNNLGLLGSLAERENGGPWTIYSSTQLGAFRIQDAPANVVPEPGTAVLLLSGLGLLWVRKRRSGHR